MSDIIQCPTCGVRIQFKGAVPRQFACKKCGDVMDLSAYAPPAAAVEVAPVPLPARPVAAVAPAAGETHPAHWNAPPRHGHAHAHAHSHSRAQGMPASKIALLCVLGLAVVGLGLFFALSRGEGRGQTTSSSIAASARETEAKERAAMGLPPVPPATPLVAPPAPPPSSTPPTAPAVEPTPAEPAPAEPTPPPAEPPPMKPARRPAPAQRIAGDVISGSPVPEDQAVRTYPYADDVSGDERNRIEESIRAAVDVGGRDGREAEKALVKLGVKAVPRLISEFRAVQDRYGWDKPEGLMRGMVLDRVLRHFDGVQERLFHEYYPIDVDRDPQRARRTVQNWNWWWETGEHERNPRKPWDPKVDAKDPEDGSEPAKRAVPPPK
jgi:hypothetical protein